MNRPLKPAVRDYFEQHTLSTGQHARLEALVAVNTPKPTGRRRRITPLIGWSATAVIAALLAVIMLFPPGQFESIPMTERIALEVAHNHIRLQPLDVETGSMAGIRDYFTDLEFLPAESSLLASAGLELLGGRYCSVQSMPAAQLRVTSPDSNSLQTLSQAEYRKHVFGPLPILENGETPVSVTVKGITVRIWVEQGLLFALTEAATPEPVILPE